MVNIKNNRNKFFNEKTLIVSVDVSKFHLMVYVRCPDGKERRSSKVSNDYKGLMELWKAIEFYVIRYKLTEVIVGFESTGHYGESLINFMRDKPVKMGKLIQCTQRGKRGI